MFNKSGRNSNHAYAMKDPKAIRNCVIFTVIAAAGIAAGLIIKNPLFIIIGLIPAAVYEVIRTEGVSTKISSVLMLVILTAEIILIFTKVNFNLASYLGMDSKYIAGYQVPLGEIKIVGCTLLAVLSVILFIRTAGAYTKWLSVLIFVTSFVIIYVISPTEFPKMLQWGMKEAMRYLSYII